MCQSLGDAETLITGQCHRRALQDARKILTVLSHARGRGCRAETACAAGCAGSCLFRLGRGSVRVGGVFPRGGWFWNPLWEALVRTYSKPSERVGRGSRWNWVVSRCEEITRFVDKNSAGRLYGACCSVLHNRDKSQPQAQARGRRRAVPADTLVSELQPRGREGLGFRGRAAPHGLLREP